MRDTYGQGANQLQGLRHRLEAMSPFHRIERYQDRLLQDKRILTNRMEQVLKEQKIKVQGLSEALLTVSYTHLPRKLSLKDGRLVQERPGLVSSSNKVCFPFAGIVI